MDVQDAACATLVMGSAVSYFSIPFFQYMYVIDCESK